MLTIVYLVSGHGFKVDCAGYCLHSGESVGHGVVHPGNVAGIRRELADVIQMAKLSGRTFFGFLPEGECDGFMVRENRKISAFYHVFEMFDRQIYRQDFSIASTIFSFRRAKLLRKKGEWLPRPVDMLLCLMRLERWPVLLMIVCEPSL